MATTQIKNGFQGGNDDQLLVNPDGSINVNSGGGGGGNASVGATGTLAPTSGTEIAGINPEGKLTAVTVDDNGFLNVNGVSTITGPVTTEQAGLNSFKTSQFTVGTSAIQITPTPLPNRSSVSFRVEADANTPIYIGNSSSVTVTNGYPLYDGDTLSMDLTPSDTIYAVSTIAGQILAVLELA